MDKLTIGAVALIVIGMGVMFAGVQAVPDFLLCAGGLVVLALILWAGFGMMHSIHY